VSSNLFNEICRIASDDNETLATSAQHILDALVSGKIDLALLFENLLNENDRYFEQIAANIPIDQKILAFFTYHSMKPSLKAYAQAISQGNQSSDQWEKGFCPVCGNFPGLATLENGGGKFLFCSFCWNKWRTHRIFCPFCETENQKVLHYFYSEKELEYRVDTCNECKKYIKTVDVRNLDRIFYPPLEQISTLHLDMKAEELGFTNPIYLYQ
jgi:FdhE protein